MSFDASIPQSGQSPSLFPAQNQTNMSRLKTIISANHQFNDAVDASDGKHNFCQFPEQASDPSTAANEFALYAKEAQSVSQLVARRENNGSLLNITAGSATNTTAQAAAGYTCIPGGLLLQWGVTGNIGAGATSVINFNTNFSAAAYNVITTQSGTSSSDANGNVSSFNAGNFTIKNSGSNAHAFYWLAIGPA